MNPQKDSPQKDQQNRGQQQPRRDLSKGGAPQPGRTGQGRKPGQDEDVKEQDEEDE